jgi:branched-chain amino acid transport system substrate-binding protein
MTGRKAYLAAAIFAAAVTTAAAAADTPGVTATEIKIGNTVPYSGPASSYSVLGKLESAYFGMMNEKGGVAGHKINFISLDDNYSPPKTVEQIRRLVEEEQVAFTFATLGTPTNSAIVRYMNQKKVPQLFVSTGADKWGLQADTMDHRLAAQLPHRGADLHQVHASAAPEREAGDPVSER